MIEIFALIFAKITFSFITIFWKNLRKKGVDTLANLAIFVFCVPILLIIGYYALQNFELIINLKYLLIVFLWLIPVFLANVFDVYLLKYQSLTEQSSYNLAIGTFLALLIDFYFFKMKFSFFILIAILLFFIGGSILTKNKIPKTNKLSLKIVFIIIASIAILDVIEDAIYKEGLLMQDTILFHIIITQSLLYLLFFAFGYKTLIPNIKNNNITTKDIIGINFLIIIYIILEAIALKNLPLSVIVSASILPLVIFSVFDFKNKEIQISSKSIFALILVSIGIILLSLA